MMKVLRRLTTKKTGFLLAVARRAPRVPAEAASPARVGGHGAPVRQGGVQDGLAAIAGFAGGQVALKALPADCPEVRRGPAPAGEKEEKVA